MEQTTNTRNTLWINAVLMEVVALLFFFGKNWNVVNELSGDHPVASGTLFIVLAALYTAGALAKRPPVFFIRALATINIAAGLYCIELLATMALSAVATEILIVESLANLVMGVLIFYTVKRSRLSRTQVYPS